MMAGGVRLLVAACLLLIPLPLFLPYLWLDHFYFWGNVDSIFYLNTYTSYRDALKAGEFFPHWINGANLGLGGLSFYSLSPLAYSLTALVSAPFPLSDEGQFLLGLYASQVFGAWAMWYWLARRYGNAPALAGALIYTLIPYKLVVLYLHFNLAQAYAMAFLPLWMRAAEHIMSRKGQFAYGLAAALCFYAHPLTVISTGPLALAYALHRSRWQWRTVLKPLLVAHLLALALVASYLTAMLTALPWMQFQHWGMDYFNSLKNLHHIDNYFGLYVPALAYIFYRFRKAYPAEWFWGVAALVLYVVATPLSYPLWAFVPVMDIFQFPFARLQPGMAVAVAAMAVAMLSRRNREFTLPLLAILVLTALVVEFRLQLVYGHHPDNGITPTIHKTARDGLITTSTMPSPIYFPAWTDMTLKELQERHKELESLPRIRLRDGKGDAIVTGEGNGWLSLHAGVQSSIATFTVSQFYVPAWQALSDKQAIFVKPGPRGLIQLALPKGEYDITLRIAKTPLEKAADALTLAALALNAFMAVIRFRRRAQ